MATWCLPGSGFVLEHLGQARHVEEQRGARIWAGFAAAATAMPRGQSGVKARESAQELSSAAQRLQRFDGMDEREQGGPGRPGKRRGVPRRHGGARRGEGERWTMAFLPKPPASFFFSVFLYFFLVQ